MQKFIILFHLLSFFTLLNSQNLFLEGELTSCHASLKHVDLEISSLKFELSAPEEEPKLQQSLTQTYRQSGSLKVRIPKAEWKKFPVLSENCLGGKTPFSLVLPRLLPLRIKADVNPKTLEMNWLEWLSPPALEEVLAVNLFSGTEGGDSEIFSKEEDVDLPSDLAEMKDPQAYPPGGNGYGSITYDNGDTYTGYFKNYRRDGKGIYRGSAAIPTMVLPIESPPWERHLEGCWHGSLDG